MLRWVKVGDRRQKNTYMASKRKLERKGNSCKLGAPQLFLTNHDMGLVYEHQTYPNHTASLLYSSLVLSLTMGPIGQETHLPLLQRIILLLLQFFNRKQIKKWKRTQTTTKICKQYIAGELSTRRIH
jgi:hypothetical protein